jgi:phosphoglycerate dehydrogenase-like enzyme
VFTRLQFTEGPTRADANPGWRRPERIVVRLIDDRGVDWLRAVAPGIELVGARTAAEAARLARDADAVFGFCTPEIVAAGSRLRWIQLYSAGVEACVPLPGIRDRRVLLTNMQKVAGPVIAEHLMAMTLSLARGLHLHADAQRRGRWEPDLVGRDRAVALSGRTMLIVGLGGIGTEIARLAAAFDMRVLGIRASSRPAPPFVERVGTSEQLMAFLPEADVVVNVLPQTEATSGLLDARAFAAMKPSAWFVNVGRGGTVVTDDLVAALRDGRLAAAALDVTDPEPLPEGHPLWAMPNVIITPHVAADARLDLELRWLLARENLRRYINGERMLAVVDPAQGY